jgi:uncharacterized membrane protein
VIIPLSLASMITTLLSSSMITTPVASVIISLLAFLHDHFASTTGQLLVKLRVQVISMLISRRTWFPGARPSLAGSIM